MVPPNPNNVVALPGLRYTQKMIDDAIQIGKDAAKKGKTVDGLFEPYRQNPRWVLGHAGTVHESYVYLTDLNAMPLAYDVWHAVKFYEPIKIDDQYTPGAVQKNLTFVVNLCAISKMKKKWIPFVGVSTASVDAEPEDVKVQKFVLSDDQNNNIAADEVKTGDVKAGSNTLFGTNSVTTFCLAGQSSWTSTIFEPWSEKHPKYTVEYNVDFSLYDEKDNLVLASNTKQITLRIITSKGEQDVVYKLPK